jgi:hypothetical protein
MIEHLPAAMVPEQALVHFLERVLLRQKAERFITFARSKKAHSKFLDTLYHQFSGLIDSRATVSALPAIAWETPAFRFRPPREFGVSVETLRFDYDSGVDNVLCITHDGKYGFWHEETYCDSQLLFDVSRATP